MMWSTSRGHPGHHPDGLPVAAIVARASVLALVAVPLALIGG
jgi:hypothetical protein